RKACITAGIFSRVRPRDDRLTPAFIFVRTLLQKHGTPPLTALMIDLSNPKVWDICTLIMIRSPYLNELGFTGSSNLGFNTFRTTHLYQLCGDFKGHTLILKDAVFTGLSLGVLSNMAKCNIRTLILERSILYNPHLDRLSRPALFPSLKKVKFVGAPMDATGPDVSGQATLAAEVLINAKITHFEISYGFRPCLSARRELFGTEGYMLQNKLYISLRYGILDLMRLTHEYIKVYIEHDELVGPFIGKDYFLLPQYQRLIRIMVYRCENLETLMAFDGSHDCSVDMDIEKHRINYPFEDHSI